VKHLWEVEHPYSCAPDNYFGQGQCEQTVFLSWAEFLEEYGAADLDYNLVFRWDWTRATRKNELLEDQFEIFFMKQRKGIYQSARIDGIRKQDEPEVRAWLEPRFKHLLSLWEPL
jgi:hypothetical protein